MCEEHFFFRFRKNDDYLQQETGLVSGGEGLSNIVGLCKKTRFILQNIFTWGLKDISSRHI